MQEQATQYVGFWKRVVASIIDGIIFSVITLPLLVYIYGWEYFDVDKTGWIAGPAEVVINWVFPAVVVILFWVWKQATPGKMIFSAKIVDAKTGGKPSTGQYIGRYFGYFVSAIPLCLGYIWVAFDARKQGWHDKLAGTVVVRQ